MWSRKDEGPHHFNVGDETDVRCPPNEVVDVPKSLITYCSAIQKLTFSRITSPLKFYSRLSIISQ